MTAASASATIVATAARELLRDTGRRRLDSELVRARAGLSHALVDAPQGTLPLAAFTSLLEIAAEETGNSVLGLELGRDFPVSSLGPLATMLQSAPTLGVGLEMFTRHFKVIQTGTRTALETDGATARLIYVIDDPAVRFRAQDAAFTLAMEVAMLRGLLGAQWRPAMVEFVHRAEEDVEAYRRHFGCPIVFGSHENALTLLASDLRTRLPAANRALNARLVAQIVDATGVRVHASNLLRDVEAWMSTSICRSAEADISIVARDFGISVRSLQRALADHGTSFLDIRNRVRSHLAKCMLRETDLPVTSIALHLGYSEASAFTRGFKATVGSSPITFRRMTRRQDRRGAVPSAVRQDSIVLRDGAGQRT